MLKILELIIGPIFGAIDKILGNTAEATKLKAEINRLAYENISQELTAKKDILIAEIGGESWLQRNWRPLLMMICIIIVANNYLIAPYAGLLFGVDASVPLDERIWDLMTLGVGGYVGLRTVEKVVKSAAPAIADAIAGSKPAKVQRAKYNS